jgi:hypothetical protein
VVNRPAEDVPIGKFDILATCLPAEAHPDELAVGRAGMARRIPRRARTEPTMNLDPTEIAGPGSMPFGLFTIGHSTHPLDVFLKLLDRHGIEALADIRRFPGSRKYPHFNREHLASALPEASVEYRWVEALGGRRKGSGGSTRNHGLRNESFRNYADYMSTPAFHEAVGQLLELARRRRTAFMCSEGLFWRCHRRLVSDDLLVRGIAVQHIMPDGQLRPHSLTEGARIDDGGLSYPPPQTGHTPTLLD